MKERNVTASLLYQQWRLVVSPVVYAFMPLALMLLIPSYPFTVALFYTCLGIFLSLLGARENGDLRYLIQLPVPKRAIVRARYLLVISIELLQLLLAALAAALRAVLTVSENAAGLEPDTAFFGAGLVLFAVFNTVFFGGYFKDCDRVGVSFVKASIAVFLWAAAAEASVHVARAVWGGCFWDSMAPSDQLRQLPILAAGAAVFAGSALLRFRVDARHFERQDL